MFLQVVRSVESLVANVTRVCFVLLVLLHVSQAIVLSYELSAAVVARVWTHIAVGVHVSRVVAVTIKGSAALIALERFGAASCMSPLVQLKIPLGAEGL